MVGERVRFLFTSCDESNERASLRASEFDSSQRVNKNCTSERLQEISKIKKKAALRKRGYHGYYGYHGYHGYQKSSFVFYKFDYFMNDTLAVKRTIFSFDLFKRKSSKNNDLKSMEKRKNSSLVCWLESLIVEKIKRGQRS